MPIIPNATRIERAIPSGQQAVIRPDVSNAGLGIGDLGKAVGSVAQDVKQRELIDRQAAVSKADLTMTTALEKGGRAFDERTDHVNFLDEYDKDATEAMGIAGEAIDIRDQEEWVAKQKLKIERMRTRVMGVRQVKLRDDARASFSEQLREARETALTGDMGETGEVVENMAESMVLQGFMDREEAENTVASFKEDSAVGRLRMMDPVQRLEALDQPWADNLPSDKRAMLKREAETEAVKYKAVATVDDVIKTSKTREEGQAKIDGIKDPQERIAAEARYNSEYAANDAAKTEARLELYNELSLTLEEGGKYEDLPEGQLDELKPAERANLRNTQLQVAKPRTISDPATFNAATRMSARGDWEGLRELLSGNGSNLTSADYKSFIKAAEESIAPAAVTTQQILNGLLPGTNNKEMRDGMLLRMNSWRNEWVQSTGSEPKQSDIEKEVLRRTQDLVNAKGQSGWQFDEEPIYGFDIDAAQRAALLDQVTRLEMEEENPGAYDTLGTYMSGQGMDPGDRFLAQAVWVNQTHRWNVENSPHDYIKEYGLRADAIFEEAGIRNPSNEQWLITVGKIKAKEAVDAAQ